MTTTATSKADADKPMEESAERLARPLIKLAKACGVATFYIDQQGSYTEITDEALVGVLDALGMPADTQDNIAISYEKFNANALANYCHQLLFRLMAQKLAYQFTQEMPKKSKFIFLLHSKMEQIMKAR